MAKKKVKFFKPEGSTGWKKTYSQKKRRRFALNSSDGSYVTAGRKMIYLANVTEDRETETKARADAAHFFAKNRASKR